MKYKHRAVRLVQLQVSASTIWHHSWDVDEARPVRSTCSTAQLSIGKPASPLLVCHCRERMQVDVCEGFSWRLSPSVVLLQAIARISKRGPKVFE